jgi:uncharacterized protein YaiI (UPF0178 family)
MTIWIDADACPRVIRDILCKAAVRVKVPLIFVANHSIPLPPSPLITFVQVPQRFDVADNYIVQKVEADDLVITSDIPLAAELIAKGAQVVTPRGERFTKENIGPRLNMRDFMETMRSSMEVGGGPPALGSKDKQAFANVLDTYLAKLV